MLGREEEEVMMGAIPEENFSELLTPSDASSVTPSKLNTKNELPRECHGKPLRTNTEKNLSGSRKKLKDMLTSKGQ